MPTRAPSRLRRAALIGSVAVLLVVVLLAVAGWVLTRSAVLVAIVESGLSDRIGGNVEIDSATWHGWGDIELAGISIRAPDLAGAAGEIAIVDRLRMVVEPAVLLFGGGSPVSTIDVEGAVLRVMTNVDDPLDLNVGHLFGARVAKEAAPGTNVPAVGVESPLDLPARISIRNIALEIGEFEGEGVRITGERLFDGQAVPGDEPGIYDLTLHEVDAAAGTDGIVLAGGFNRRAMSLDAVVTGIDLSTDLEILPGIFGEYCRKMDIKGEVVEVSIGVARGESPRLSALLEDVAMSFPSELGLDSQWARFEDRRISSVRYGIPRMVAERGEIIYNGKSFRIDGLRGQFLGDRDLGLAAVDFELDLAIAAALDASSSGERSFVVDLRTDQFHLGDQPGDATRADLPKIVAQILDMFDVRTCDVSIALLATGRFVGDAVTDYQLEGRVGITDASGAYEGFPYPLADLDAQVGFDAETVTVHSLDAVGAGASRIGIKGRVVPLRDGAEVDLKLTAVDLPLDAALMDAVPDEAAYTLRSLFGRHGARVPADRIESEHEVVGLDLDILRSPGPDEPTRLEGRILFDDLDLTWSSFPYPITLEAGSLDWRGDVLSLMGPDGSDEVRFRTPSGTQCKVKGFIHLPTGDQQASGVLDLEVPGEPITRDLLQAMDRVSPETSDLIEALRLEGMLSVAGPVEVDSLGNTRYGLLLRIREGSVTPRDHLSRILGVPAAFWPNGLRLDELDVTLFATDQQVEVVECTAESGDMVVSMGGVYHLADPPLTRLEARVGNAIVQERLLDLAAGRTREILAELYGRWSPTGTMDVEIDVRGQGADSVSVRIDEADIQYDATGVEQRIRIVGGACRIESGRLELEELRIDGSAGDQLDGQYALAGTMEWGDRIEAASLRAEVDRGRFESALLGDLLEVLAGDEAARPYRTAELRGRFDATARIDLQPDRPLHWEFALEPEFLEAQCRGAELTMEFDGGSLEAQNGELSLESVSGVSRDGAFMVSGTISPGDVVKADLRFDYDGRLRSPEAEALLPEQAVQALRAISFDDGDGTSVRGGRLQLEVDATTGETTGRFAGDLLFTGASLRPGIGLEGIDGRLGLRVHAAPDVTTELELAGELGRMTALDQQLRTVDVELRLVEDAALELVSLSGDVAGGEIHASGSCSLEGDRPWAVDVMVTDCMLSQLFADDESADSERLDGSLYAGLSMTGTLDGADPRIGHGKIRLYEGEMGPLPVIVGVYQILQLSMPVVEAPQFVSVDYHTVADEILLDRIRIESHMGDTVAFSLTGSGTFDWESKRIDAVLRPRSSWAILSDVIGVVLDRLYAIGVEGSIEDPDVFIIPFPEERPESKSAWVSPLY